MEVRTRYVHILGVTANRRPGRPSRSATLLDLGERAGDFRFLVRDRAGKFTALSTPYWPA